VKGVCSMTEISVIPVSSSIRPPEKMQERTEKFLQELNTIEGFEFGVLQENQESAEAEILLILSGGAEIPAVEYAKNRPGPFILLAHPLDNSFAAALEILAYLQGTGKKAVLVQAFGDWKKELQRLLEICVAGNDIINSRIGRVGEEKYTRYPFQAPVTELIKKNWGPEIVDISFSEVTARVQQLQGEPRAAQLAEEMIAASKEVVEPGADTIKGAAVIYLALREIIDEYMVDAIAVKCFDLLPILKNTACYALAKLNEEGLVAACEGDIITATGMLIANRVTGEPSFMANPSVVDLEKSSITLAHCTIPRTMVSSYKLRSHFESGIGVAYQGAMY